jgi:anthranilate synthase/aminodeoxychorismate synthase-like glutamine amidotransferase
MIVIIDNYDSFVYNLAQYIGELGCEPAVYRNDRITPAQIGQLDPSHIIISPGPCTPLEAGISNDVIRMFAGKIPILGVCLGHQCIGYVYGDRITGASVPVHGKSSLIYHDGKTIYEKLPRPFEAGRYHSLVVSHSPLSPMVEVTSVTDDGVVMGIRHSDYVVEGVQFHPESIMTDTGHDILRNFLNFNQPLWPQK